MGGWGKQLLPSICCFYSQIDTREFEKAIKISRLTFRKQRLKCISANIKPFLLSLCCIAFASHATIVQDRLEIINFDSVIFVLVKWVFALQVFFKFVLKHPWNIKENIHVDIIMASHVHWKAFYYLIHLQSSRINCLGRFHTTSSCKAMSLNQE